MPTLDVAVIDLPRPAGPFVRSPAGARVARLLYLPLLANESEDATHGKAANQLVTNMEIGDIGRKIDLKLKTGPAWSDGSRQVAAIDVVRSLSDRAQPRSPGYSARWADLLERVEITDEQQVTIRLNRPILKPEAWLLGPVGPGHAAWDGRVPTPDGKRRPVGDGPFNSETESDNSATYTSAAPRTAVDRPDGQDPPHTRGPLLEWPGRPRRWRAARSRSSSTSRPTASTPSSPSPTSRSAPIRVRACIASRSTAAIRCCKNRIAPPRDGDRPRSQDAPGGDRPEAADRRVQRSCATDRWRPTATPTRRTSRLTRRTCCWRRCSWPPARPR